MNFVKLKRQEDWGTIYFAVEPLTEKGMASAERGIKFIKDEQILVKFPNGVTDSINIDFKLEGHYEWFDNNTNSIYIPNKIPGFYVYNNGIKLFIPIDEVEVDYYWAYDRNKNGWYHSK